jgi:hypothetical protein
MLVIVIMTELDLANSIHGAVSVNFCQDADFQAPIRRDAILSGLLGA